MIEHRLDLLRVHFDRQRHRAGELTRAALAAGLTAATFVVGGAIVIGTM